MTLPRIGITTGDPNGIGPEISLKAARSFRVRKLCRPVLFGSRGLLAQTARRFGLSLEGLEIHDTGRPGERLSWGRATGAGGAAAMAAIDAALQEISRKNIGAMVTAPIAKEAVERSGLRPFTGHTEYIARFARAPRYSLALYARGKSIAFVSTHVSLRRALGAVKRARVIAVAGLLRGFLQSLGIRKPRLAVAGLNPHAGEGGLMGREELDVILPAIRQLKVRGFNVAGPLPPDVVFAQLFGGRFDGVVSMIHDHGHVAFKTFHFSLGAKAAKVSGVNVTLGLPFVRTSADHGTAFDIAGKNLADPGSLVEAVDLAVRLSKRRG